VPATVPHVAYAETLAAFRRGDNVEAGRLAALDLWSARAQGDAVGEVDALCMLARVALRDGDLELVRERATDAQQIAETVGDDAVGRMPLHLRAVAARMSGRYDEARELYLESIRLNDALGEEYMAAAEHRNLAYSEIRAGNVATARDLISEARRRVAGRDFPTLRPYLIFDEATIAALDSDYRTAAARLREADGEFEAQGIVPDPDDAAEIADLRRRVSAL
jgi:tetratricopeptide (TPR) repeat protein